ncbi:tripartite motif-containing protein 59 isoform X1 [Esox lucius]|uniref:Tripartite motif containing 59 n=1 Tax=Esox lucius TaxID=8010 RepID=A0A3P8ZA09_ESOLU|nr:tripartite motif-containing protein 59 isoform X1 [Esox lucius]XP_010898359.2 tripartite motif-containing protein 59 isoform X1 [Esox lucius]XP_010898436.2 tripartite motif-containing protein 59 isoform X1 [Esox lucius]
MDNLEEDLTCSVCYSLFADPRVLPCSHTFCKSCLENVLQVSAVYTIWRPLRLPLKCPNCRSVVELPPAGVDALPTNVSLRAIIEKFQKDSQPRSPSCPEHHRQPLNVYCVQDRQLICGFCLTVGQHQGHPIDDLQAAFIRERQAPAGLLGKLSDHRWAECCLLKLCELGQQLEQEKASCEGLVRQDRQAVEQYFHGLEVVLARKKVAFMGALDTASMEVSLAYDPLIQRLKGLQEEQLDLVSLGTALEDENSPLDFLEKVHLFRERVEVLVKSSLPKVPSLSITPRAADYLEQHWAGVTMGHLEEGPVPRVCVKPTVVGMVLGTEAVNQPGGWGRYLWLQLQPMSPVVLLGLLLLLVAVWINPVVMSMCSSLLQVLHGLSSEMTSSMWEMAGFLYSQTGAVMGRCSSVISTLGENSYQQLLSLWS